MPEMVCPVFRRYGSIGLPREADQEIFLCLIYSIAERPDLIEHRFQLVLVKQFFKLVKDQANNLLLLGQSRCELAHPIRGKRIVASPESEVFYAGNEPILDRLLDTSEK